MNSYHFIFSKRYRLKRHLLFWLCWWVFQSVLYAFTPNLLILSHFKGIYISTVEALIFMPPHIFLAYTLMYFVIPGLLLKGKYILTAASVILLFLATGVMSAIISIYLVEAFRKVILPGSLHLPLYRNFASALFFSLLAGLRGGITIGGIAAAIKLMKYWYSKEQKNLQLQKENTESQLQLLKAQVHPHFLFNTLNNIYSHTQNTSAVAAELVMGLSAMLRCMLYECDRPLIPLAKEVAMLENYILLEKIRYGNKLDISIDVPEIPPDLYIVPLLLLPFVENSFKHGTSQIIEQPWLSIYMNITGSRMHLRLLNGKPAQPSRGHVREGIGIQNVRRRLDLLYTGKYSIDIRNEEEVFIVDLALELKRENINAKYSSAKNEITA